MIDAHVHLLPPPAQHPGYRVEPPAVAGSDTDLVRTLDAHEVDRAVVVQTPWMGEDNAYLLAAARRHPGRVSVVGWLERPAGADAPDRIEAQYADGVRGLRLHLVDDEEIAAAAAGGLDAALATTQRLGVPVLLLFREPRVFPVVAGLAIRHPGVTFVLDHLGHVDPARPDDAAALLSLAAAPGTVVKLCLHYRLSRQPAPWPDLRDLQRRLVDRYGPQRLLWGSNFPLHLDASDYASRLAAVRDHLGLTADETAAVLHGTAARLWPRPGDLSEPGVATATSASDDSHDERTLV